jgi:hypothetical protein
VLASRSAPALRSGAIAHLSDGPSPRHRPRRLASGRRAAASSSRSETCGLFGADRARSGWYYPFASHFFHRVCPGVASCFGCRGCAAVTVSLTPAALGLGRFELGVVIDGARQMLGKGTYCGVPAGARTSCTPGGLRSAAYSGLRTLLSAWRRPAATACVHIMDTEAKPPGPAIKRRPSDSARDGWRT